MRGGLFLLCSMLAISQLSCRSPEQPPRYIVRCEDASGLTLVLEAPTRTPPVDVRVAVVNRSSRTVGISIHPGDLWLQVRTANDERVVGAIPMDSWDVRRRVAADFVKLEPGVTRTVVLSVIVPAEPPPGPWTVRAILESVGELEPELGLTDHEVAWLQHRVATPELALEVWRDGA